MPQYAVIQAHPPNICPLTNKHVREFAKKAFDKMPELEEKMKVKVVTYIHLDPKHKAFMLLDAPNAETARDFLVMAGFMHVLDMDFHLVSQVKDLMANADAIPTLY